MKTEIKKEDGDNPSEDVREKNLKLSDDDIGKETDKVKKRGSNVCNNTMQCDFIY